MTEPGFDPELTPELAPVFDPEAVLPLLTERPGVYRMYGADDAVLYVGKARNLKARVSSYFRGQQSLKTQALVRHIQRIETTVTASESEALLLESNLIKAHRPRYNILLRDDKSYPWIFLSSEQTYPRLAYHRGARKANGRYFGPYSAASAVRETLALLEKVFKVRQCEDSVFRNRSRPCLQYQIGRCKAPCVGFVSPEDYAQDVRDTVAFLSGKSQALIETLVTRMEQAAERLAFEEAASLRDQISQLRAISQQQAMTGVAGDADVVALVELQGLVALAVSTIRDGRHLGTRSFFPSVPAGAEPPEVLDAFLGQYYADRSPPPQVLCAVRPAEADFLEAGLTQARGTKVVVRVPQRGVARDWLQQTQQNATLAAGERLATRAGLAQRLAALSARLGMATIDRVECFDISHTQGEATVASCVAFGLEGAQKDQYRRYRIEGITGGDDYAAMHQALTRRFSRAASEGGRLPEVLLIDGGAGQVAQAQAVLAALSITTVQIVGVAKGPERRAGEERLVFPKSGQGKSGHSGGEEIRLDPHDPALHLIQQVRDEAHRFAITGHRAQRHKARTQSDLEKIPGVGAKRRQLLLKQFGGLQGLRQASAAELATVPGISTALAQTIHAWLHEGG